MIVYIEWMDGKTIRYRVATTNILNGTLNLYGVGTEDGRKLSDKHIPISNIRYWDSGDRDD